MALGGNLRCFNDEVYASFRVPEKIVEASSVSFQRVDPLPPKAAKFQVGLPTDSCVSP